MAETGATQPEELDHAWAEGFAKRWEAAWNSHEPARVLELMTDDIVYDDSSWPTTMRGQGDVRTLLEFFWRAFPDLRFETVEGPYIVLASPRPPSTGRVGVPTPGRLTRQASRRPASASSLRASTSTSTAGGASAG